jgi:iron complex outermembrane receptor protein
LAAGAVTRRRRHRARGLAGAIALHAWMPAPPAMAQQGPAATTLPPVVVSASITERRGFDAPFAASVVDAEELRQGGLMVNLSEALGRVPGLTVNARGNYAQDLQISSRGFGARAPFGVRGLRLYTDGIPATMPDGQGQVTHFDLAGAQRIEVLRGPFSALYGSSSGGVISLVSAAPTRRAFQADADTGSDGTRQWRVGAEAPLGDGWDLRVQGSHFETDGPRPHSRARRDLANVRLGWRGASDNVTVLLNSIDQSAQDPLGLSRAQWSEAGPSQPVTTPQALQFDTRKNADQTQLGTQWKHRFADAGALESGQLMAYTGRRSVTQWQAIPVAVQQASATQPGGVVDFDRGYRGVDARLTWGWVLDDRRSARLVAGVSVEQQEERRRGFENFVAGDAAGSAPRLGVTGALRRDEKNTARTREAYLQGELDLHRDVTATLGLRAGELRIVSRDFYVSGANGDDSGALRLRYATPVAALQWRASPALNLYVSAGQGFESPTLAELAYGARPGLNDTLQAQRSRQFEAGAKWRDEGGASGRLSADVALFRIATRDEIGVLSNTGGRATYQNVGRTTRQGAEAAGRWQFAPAWRAQVALAWLDAVYRDSFPTPGGPVAAGTRIAGTVDKSMFAELAWRARPGTEAAVELRASGRVPVNDMNSDFAGGAGVWALRLSQSLALPTGELRLLARLDNATDRRYAGSVIVNEGNGRYFEPAAGRTWLLGAKWVVPFD